MKRLLCAALLLSACTPAAPPVVIDPPPPRSGPRELPDVAGRASFFLPVQIPFTEVRRQVEEMVPLQIEQERQEDFSNALEEDAWRLLATRGRVAVGFSADRFVFRFPVEGRLTFSGRLRPVPLGRGVPVRETVDFSGTVTGSVKPDLAPDWQIRLESQAQLDLSKAEVEVFDLVKISLRPLLQDELDPILARELRKAAERTVADLKLRQQAAEAWRALHFSQEVLDGQGLWMSFRPAEVRIGRLQAGGGLLRAGIAVAGQLRLGFTGAAKALPPPTPLPVLGLLKEPAGRLEIDVPILASDADLSRLAAQRLRGKSHRTGAYEVVFSDASLRVLGDSLLMALDFEAKGPFARGARGRLFVRGQPVFDPEAKVLRLARLDYDIATRSRLLQAADWLLRSDLLATLEKEARFDVAATLREADRRAQEGARNIRFPAGLKGEIRLDSATVTDLVVADGYLYARCRVTGTATPLTLTAGL